MNPFLRRVIGFGCRRPGATPKAITLFSVGSLLALSIALPVRVTNPALAADEVERVAVSPVRPQRPVSFRDRLVVGLKARLKSEVAFVDLVVDRVNSGHLPQRLVDETYFWARQRASVRRQGRARRPILFFQPAMRARAMRLGIDL
jgi:hypothetical protein